MSEMLGRWSRRCLSLSAVVFGGVVEVRLDGKAHSVDVVRYVSAENTDSCYAQRSVYGRAE